MHGAIRLIRRMTANHVTIARIRPRKIQTGKYLYFLNKELNSFYLITAHLSYET